MNQPLARALRGAGLDAVDVAAQLGVDPKTVDRWLAGRMPYPRHRAALARLTGWMLRDLWPELPAQVIPDMQADEVRIVYPYRSAVPADAWSRLFAQAQEEISILAYSALFLAEDLAASTILCNKATAGVRVRLALGQPDGAHVADRSAEEGVGGGMSARIHNALVGFSRLIEAGAELRLHDTVLYNSVYRADGEALINTHIYGRQASHAPVLHLRIRSDIGMAATYLDSFERVWAASQERVG
ncbi:XRE family transcriptional regulator [Paractinoplanes hotanensis]|uniref:XRE family transcriptional regulator n=1 Tax=Paractinoplanes hotanensis TaxID=2906497 RepID=A0ABT0YGH2_9ACTN|nr:XRE family transcriptional regulator [Actinoplanes hotanensis]MCM4085153.1 XRE family transcriptional regulator [Actinoplanes hotanensis]